MPRNRGQHPRAFFTETEVYHGGTTAVLEGGAVRLVRERGVALVKAVWRRGGPETLLHHSDQGSPLEFNRSSQHVVMQRSVTAR